MCVLVVFVVSLCLLDQSRAAPSPWEQGSLQPFLQRQVYQTTPSPTPGLGRQRRTSSSSSSSSSSSASSESSQSSEGVQQLRERHRLENTAVEQTDSSQESWESPSNSSSLWLSELVILGQRAGEREGERDNGDDSAGSEESRQRTLLLTFHPLLTRPRLRGPGPTAGEAAARLSGVTGEGGGAITEADRSEGEVGGATVEVGRVRGEEVDDKLPRQFDHSTERAGLTFDSPDHAHPHGHHGNEAELELGL